VITGRTRVVFLLADPVTQAQSPMLVNALLAERGIDAVMAPLQVPAGALAPALDAIRASRNVAGALVSMPHKTALTSLVDEVARAGREVGACNVVRREADGRLTATMFDGEGFVAGLRAAGHDLRGRRALLVGAGGRRRRSRSRWRTTASRRSPSPIARPRRPRHWPRACGRQRPASTSAAERPMPAATIWW